MQRLPAVPQHACCVNLSHSPPASQRAQASEHKLCKGLADQKQPQGSRVAVRPCRAHGRSSVAAKAACHSLNLQHKELASQAEG